jgi:hypothetical protein
MIETTLFFSFAGLIAGFLGYLNRASAIKRKQREQRFREDFLGEFRGLRLKYQDPDGFTAYRVITTFEQLEMERRKLENHGIDYDLEYRQ